MNAMRSTTSSLQRPPRANLVARSGGISWLAHPDRVSLEDAAAVLPSVDGRLALLAGGAGSVDPASALAWARLVTESARWALLYGPAADAMARALEDVGGSCIIVRCADVDDGVRVAAALAADGDSVLLAPGRPRQSGQPDPGERYRLLCQSDELRRAAEAA